MRMRKGMLNRITAALLMLALIAGLAGCRKETGTDEESAANGVYRIYYVSASGTELLRRSLKPENEDFDGILKEVLEAFQTPPDEGVKSALPENVKINSAAGGIAEIDVDFSAEYLGLDTLTEILLRAALVKTLLQFNGVDAVRFTVDGQPLVIGEKEIGLMGEDTFVVPTGGTINSYRFLEFPLYFAGQDGTSLVREMRSLYYSSNVNTERMIVEQVIEGPQNQNLLPVISKETLVRRVAVEDGICTVDLSAEANSQQENGVDPETALYAFVNSILDSCEEEGITGIRFLVEGDSQTRFRGQVNLDQTFTRRPDEEPVTEG